MLPLEVVGLMVTLLSFVIDPPPGPIQLISTSLGFTPLTVRTVQSIVRLLPTAAFSIGPDGDMVTFGMGTTETNN